MFEAKEITFKPTIFSKVHKLIIDPEFIEFHKSPDKEPLRFSKLEIDSIRYSIRRFSVGTNYFIDIKNAEGKIITYQVQSILNIKYETLKKKYYYVLNSILEYYFIDIINLYCKRLDDNLQFSILNIHFNSKGVALKEKYEITWEHLGLKLYGRYLTVFSKDKSGLYQTFDFSLDWNTTVVYNVIRSALKAHGLLDG